MALLTAAYVRRKQWEAKVEAVEMVNALAQALGGKKGKRPQKPGRKHVPFKQFLGIAGRA